MTCGWYTRATAGRPTRPVPPGAVMPPETLRRGGSRPATKQEMFNFFEHLEEELVRNGFLRNRESRPGMVRNLRSLFQRAQCTEQELRTLPGVITSFAGPRERGVKAEEAAEG